MQVLGTQGSQSGAALRRLWFALTVPINGSGWAALFLAFRYTRGWLSQCLGPQTCHCLNPAPRGQSLWLLSPSWGQNQQQDHRQLRWGWQLAGCQLLWSLCRVCSWLLPQETPLLRGLLMIICTLAPTAAFSVPSGSEKQLGNLQHPGSPKAFHVDWRASRRGIHEEHSSNGEACRGQYLSAC